MYVPKIPPPPSIPPQILTNISGEVIGYICRTIAYNNTASLVLYLLQSIFLLLPPVLFAASLYMVFSRILRSIPGAESYSPISPRWCTRIFLLGDWICLNIQSTGGGLTGSSNAKLVDVGQWIVVVGLLMQVLIFVGFMWCCIVFHSRFRGSSQASQTQVPWERILYMLYGTSILISVRNVFRLVEYIMGKGSYLFAHEWPIYAFDGVLMLVVMVVFLVWYPDQLKRGRTESMIELRSESGGDGTGDERKVERTGMPGFGRGV
jgi:hypothetical protein